MKITRIKLENFRNIKHLEFDLTDSTIISGENELGKSNALNGGVWALTDSVYTDNLGVGENDVNSIVPKDATKGEYTSVSLEFEDGKIFTKTYKTGYDRMTGKANKHTTEGSINNVSCKNMSEWNSKLMEELNYKPCFTSVKELNMYIDPLYALQKLDSKALRTLLVSFGCTATNEEMYQLGFEDLRQYEKKYLGDFVNMRLDLKKQDKAVKESVDKYTILYSQFNSVTEFDESKLTDINARIDALQREKAKIMDGDSDSVVREYELKLQGIKLHLESEREHKIDVIKVKIHNLENDKAILFSDMNNARENETKEVRDDISRLENSIKSAEMSMTSLNATYTRQKDELERTKGYWNNAKTKKTDFQAKLIAETKRVFTGYVTCPNCGESFVADTNLEEEFEKNKKATMDYYTEQINSLNNDIASYKVKCSELYTNGLKTKQMIEDMKNAKESDAELLETKKAALESIINAPSDMSRVNAIDTEISKLNAEISNIPSIGSDSRIAAMEAKIEELRKNGNASMQGDLADIDARIDSAKDVLENLYIDRSNWRQKLEHKANLDKAIANMNNIESLIERVNDYIHTMIKVINDKAKAKTGMDFVMLEENLGNDGVKEVCYAVVDGVPFSMINTAKKYEYGIKFIEKVKDIAVNDFNLPRNDLPILADKFEGIDHIEKIKNMTKEQLICTRVGEEKEITIL